MFGLTLDQTYSTIIIVLSVLTIGDKLYSWYTNPHKHQDKEIKKNIEDVIALANKMESMTTEFNQIKETLNKIQNNHLFHIQEDIAQLRIGQAQLSTDISWIKDKLNG